LQKQLAVFAQHPLGLGVVRKMIVAGFSISIDSFLLQVIDNGLFNSTLDRDFALTCIQKQIFDSVSIIDELNGIDYIFSQVNVKLNMPWQLISSLLVLLIQLLFVQFVLLSHFNEKLVSV
jgi:hypothetical protein